MSNVEIGFIGLGVLLLLLAVRVPIAVALGSVSFVGIAVLTSSRAAWGILSAVPFNFLGDWSLSAIPMFLLMGFVASRAGLTDGLYKAMRVVFGPVPGGLAVSSVGACALFAAASGSSVATSAAMARIAVPEMLRYRYEPGLACGVIASAGTLGSLIPPSILLVIFGIFAQVSIGELFMAGFLPGLLSAVMFAAMIMVRVKLKPSLAPPLDERPSREEMMQAFRELWMLPVLVLGVLGGIFVGLFTPTEAGAVGAVLALLLAVIRGTASWEGIRQAIVETAISSTAIFVIAIGAVLFMRFMALSGVPDQLSAAMLSVTDNQILILLQVALVYLLLGMFIDSIGIMLLTLPIMLPLVSGADINLVWFGIIVIKLLEIGLVTPPVGLNVYVIKSALGNAVSLSAIFRGVMWFIVADLITLGLLILFPQISLYLPSLM
ncbi:MAG: TRAP transporter large permease [Alphaproteobacteria bacterium]|nr:TRAP transporter large permease [Alphaproteobacteria bacterium]MDX5368114.1 TRAP transporter large permease [Alphaproteobacteria bacterium]MDX5462953.1 TRAP transporter large permease [Alphaproteobacteria bacterium]